MSKPAAPPVTPDVPPQLVACGERDFYRITGSALDVFEIAAELPPPQIRGSRIARKSMELGITEPLNVFVPEKKSALVIAKDGVFRYELGRTEPRRYATIEVSSPFVAWPDPRRPEAFHVHTVGDAKLQEFVLPRPSNGDPTAKAPAKLSRRTTDLPEFDARLFTVLADGAPLYSTTKGVVRVGEESQPMSLTQTSGPPLVLFPDSSGDRFWAADASGHLALWARGQGDSPVATPSVPGVVIDAALEGDRVAVLSMELVEQSYRPTVTVFSNGKEHARLALGPSFGSRTPPKLDLCLVVGRPWVVVGGTRWLQLLDWETRRLLAEW